MFDPKSYAGGEFATVMNPPDLIYWTARRLMRVALGFYFTSIERFHTDNVPATGPVLFTSNHPNSLTDALVIGASVARKVNFVATVQLFRFRLARWILTHCGVIPINRVKDDPRAMRSVLDTFEACYRVLEKGEAVAIFPEGVTKDPPQLQPVKTGAARMALELEQRHAGMLGLHIAPVGLTFSGKEFYRSNGLVNFGSPIRVADYLPAFQANRHEAIRGLTAEIEKRIQGLMLHLPHLERERVVAAVRRLYLQRLRVGNSILLDPVTPQAGELLLTRAIVAAVDRAYEEHPARAEEFVARLDRYEKHLNRLRLSDEVLAHFPNRSWMLRQSLVSVAVAVFAAPVAIYGWMHRLIPYFIVQRIVDLSAKPERDKTHISTAAILSGAVVFTAFYGLCVFVFHLVFGWKPAVWYALSLPPASLGAHYYLKHLQRFSASFRASVVLLRAPSAARLLVKERDALISIIEKEHREIEQARIDAKFPQA